MPKVLFCTDRSRDALAAVSLGGRLAAALGAETTLLIAGKKEAHAKQALGAAERTLATFGIYPATMIRIGPAVDTCLQHVQEGDYDLVVIGYHRRKALEKMLKGCLAVRVAQQAGTSVLIVRRGRQDITRLLVGIGGEGFTADVAEWAANIAAAVGAHVTLLHVESAPPLMYAGLAEVQQTLAELLETDTATARALRQAAGILEQAGVQAEIKLAFGVTDREVLRTAQEGDHDLVILGSGWARSPLEQLMLQNITHSILLHTRRPVLVVHPGPSQRASPSSNSASSL